MKQKLHSNNTGVSSVIAVAIMVAVTVALVGLVSVVVFNFSDGGDSDDTVAGASVDLTATQDGVQVTLIRSGNADEFIVNVDGETVGETLTEEGDSTTVKYEGLYSIIGKFGNGDEEVIVTKRVEGVLNGLFTVFQDEENGEAEAQLVERYENDDEYTIVTDSSGSDDGGSTNSFTFGGEDDSRLLSRQDGELLQEIPDELPEDASEVAGIGIPGQTASSNPLKVGDKAKLHKMMGSWCEGDDILLVGEDYNPNTGEGTVLDGDEFQFDKNCGGLQTITEYSGSEITGVKLINRWQQDVNYNMYAAEGNVEPPQIGVANNGDLNFDVEVYEQDSSDNIDTDAPIEGAEVVIGNKGAKTDSDGSLTFEGIPANEQYFVTVNAGDFDGTQSPLTGVDNDDDGKIDDIEIDGSSAASQQGAPDDKGVYEFDSSSDTLKIGLNEFSPTFTFVDGNNVQPGDSTIVDYSSNGLDTTSGTQVSISAGTTSSDANGGSGSTSYSGGSASTGASFYSGTPSTTSQDVQTNSKVIKEGSRYQPEPPNNEISNTETTTSTDTEPTRSLSVGQLDKSEIPKGENIELEMSAQTNAEQEVEDTFVIYKAKVGSGNDPKEIETIDVTLPPGSNGNPGNEVTENKVITLTNSDDPSAGEPGEFRVGEEYVMYVALQSVGTPKEAGTVNVFDDSVTDLTVDLSSSSTKLTNRGSTNDLSDAIVGDDLEITLDSVASGGDVTEGGGTDLDPTVDLYRNGDLVKRVEDYNGQQLTYTETLDTAQFVDYHVGIKESTNTALLDTAAVQEVNPESDTTDDITEFEADLTINDKNGLESTQTSSLYDIEIQEQDGTNGDPLEFQVGGTFTGDDIDPSDVDYELTYGTGDGPDTGTFGSSDAYDVTFTQDGPYLVELTATFIDGSGNELKDTDTKTVNVYKPTSEVTSSVDAVGTAPDSDDFQIKVRSDRSSTDEPVDVIVSSATNNPSNDDVGGEYKLKDNFTVRGGVTETIETSVPEVANALSSASEDDAIAGMTADDSSDVSGSYNGPSVSSGDVPISVRVDSGDDGKDKSKEGDQHFLVTPDGEIQANIQADVIVNPAITVSSTDDGNNNLSAIYNDYGQGNSDSYQLLDSNGKEVFSWTDSEKGTSKSKSSFTKTGEFTIRNTTESEDIRTVFISNP